jgi:hypothetical protein
VRGRGVRGDVEGAGPGLAGAVGLAGLDVGHAQDVGQVRVLRREGAGLLEEGNRLPQVAGQVVREAQHLDRFAPLRRIRREGGQDGGQLLDGGHGVVRVVARDTDEHTHPWVGGGRAGQDLEGGRGRALVDELACAGQDGRDRVRRGRRSRRVLREEHGRGQQREDEDPTRRAPHRAALRPVPSRRVRI